MAVVALLLLISSQSHADLAAMELVMEAVMEVVVEAVMEVVMELVVVV